jgi:DNA end-binding protein Ku
VAGTLVDALEEPFEPSKYHDHYREALLELIAGKQEGRQVVTPEAEAEGAPVTDLMAALRASIEAARGQEDGSAASTSEAEKREPRTQHPPRKSAAKKPAATAARGRKKTAA